MRHLIGCLLLAGLVVSLSGGAAAVRAAEPMLAHDVYFTLKEDSQQARAQLVAACKTCLADHPGMVWFAAGALVEEHQREVNDRDFHVALHIVFKDKASHDKYQDAPRHHKFVEENGENWETVRVFDSFVGVSSHGTVMLEAEPAEGARLPDAACCFAGMIQGVVVAKRDGGFTLRVEKIGKTWRNNKAKDPQSLVGKTVLIGPRREEGKPVKAIAGFCDGLRIGEKTSIDVAHPGTGEALAIVELTPEQRARVSK